MPRDVSIYFNTTGAREVRIFSDGGRLIRPLCVVKNGKLLLTSKDITSLKTRGGGLQNVSLGKLKHLVCLIKNSLSWRRLISLLDEMFRLGKFEMIDGAETEDTFIATYFSEVNQPDMTHCEVCPLGMLGIAAGLSPYAECNQSPRNVYQAGMAKQAMGTPR